MSGARANPFPGLLATQDELPDLAVVLGGMARSWEQPATWLCMTFLF